MKCNKNFNECLELLEHNQNSLCGKNLHQLLSEMRSELIAVIKSGSKKDYENNLQKIVKLEEIQKGMK